MASITVIEINLYHIKDFIAQLKRHEMDQVFRNRSSDHSVTYAAWCPATYTFLVCESSIPQLVELANTFTKLTAYHQSSPFKFNSKYLWAEISAKTKFIELLKALGASAKTLKEFDKVSVSELRRVIDDSTQDESSVTITRSSKVHERLVPINWCGHKEAICHMHRSGNNVEYTVIIEGWPTTRNKLIVQEEKAFEKAEITVIEGSLKIANRY